VSLAVRPHDGRLADVRAAASRFNHPVRVVRPAVDGQAPGALPGPVVTVSSDPGGVEVDAVKLADDGSGDLIVRLHEACGDRTRVSVSTGRRIAEAWYCNLLEEPQRGEEVGDGSVTTTLRPFELVTLRLRPTDLADGRSLRG
jgi:alpha-mannosidase